MKTYPLAKLKGEARDRALQTLSEWDWLTRVQISTDHHGYHSRVEGGAYVEGFPDLEGTPFEGLGNDAFDEACAQSLDELHTNLKELVNNLCAEIYKDLRAEHEYETAEEQLMEMADANDYRFNCDGEFVR